MHDSAHQICLSVEEAEVPTRMSDRASRDMNNLTAAYLQSTKHIKRRVSSGRPVFTGAPGTWTTTSRHLRKLPSSSLLTACEHTGRCVCGPHHAIPVRLEPPQERG